jgi:calcium-dependent protein kinase
LDLDFYFSHQSSLRQQCRKVITYILLCGFCPFAGDTDYETLHLVKVGKLDFPSPEWDIISDEAKDFIRQLLNRDPLRRPTAEEAMKHPWIAKHVVPVQPGIPPPQPFTFTKTPPRRSGSYISSDGVPTTDDRPISISTEVRMDSTRATAFQKFLAAAKMKKALERASLVLTPEEAQLLGEVFHRVDQDRDGRITIPDLEGALKKGSGFSSTVRRNLKQMKLHLKRHPSVTFDIRPFMPFVIKRANSDSRTTGYKL